MLNFKEATKLSIQPDFARRMLPKLIVGTAVLGGLTLVAWGTGFSTSTLHPWDGLWWLLVSGVTAVLMSRLKKIDRLTAWFIGLSIQPVYYYALIYGVASPTMALILPTLIFASLLGGRTYTLWMIGFNCFFAGLAAIYTQAGWTYADPLEPLALARWGAFWAALYVVSGTLSVMISKNLSDSLASAAAQGELLTRTTRALTEEPKSTSFVQTVVSTLADQLDMRQGVLFVQSGDIIQPDLMIIDGHVHPAEGDSTLPSARTTAHMPIWAEAEANGSPFVLHNPADDPRINNKAQLRAEGIRTLFYVPVLIQGEMRALLTLKSTSRRYFRTPDYTLADALAGQLALALQLAELAAEAQQTTLLAERNRMAREIHDTLAQGFTGIVVQLDVAEDILKDGEIDDARRHIERARGLAHDSLSEARRSVYALRSLILEDRSLEQALDRMAQSLTEGTTVHATVHQHGNSIPLADEIERVLLRIGQEALTNTLKHAAATTITLKLHYKAEAIALHICDDGHGFDPNAPWAGLGLLGMQERAQGVGGRLDIESQSGQGTIITAILPKEASLA